MLAPPCESTFPSESRASSTSTARSPATARCSPGPATVQSGRHMSCGLTTTWSGLPTIGFPSMVTVTMCIPTSGHVTAPMSIGLSAVRFLSGTEALTPEGARMRMVTDACLLRSRPELSASTEVMASLVATPHTAFFPAGGAFTITSLSVSGPCSATMDAGVSSPRTERPFTAASRAHSPTTLKMNSSLYVPLLLSVTTARTWRPPGPLSVSDTWSEPSSRGLPYISAVWSSSRVGTEV
mmetsp:Transcript_6928/g.22994  ORF Transcript_6928/g.22994 Transcript_6928/m.22994 type:complete len:239 (+) Transcript_6928:2017-2733(+)